MEFLSSFLRRHLAGKPVEASPNVGCFLRLHFSNELCSHFTEAKALVSQSPPRLYNQLISYSNNFSSSNLEAAVGRAYSHDKKTQLTLVSVCHGFSQLFQWLLFLVEGIHIKISFGPFVLLKHTQLNP